MPVMHSRTSTWRALTMAACVAWIGAVCLEGAPQTEVRLKADTTSTTPARALISKYCVTCHNERLKTANLLLDKADDQIANASDTWEKVVVQLRGRSMPCLLYTSPSPRDS